MGEKNPFAGPIRRTEIPIYAQDVERYRLAAFPKSEKKAEELTGVRKALHDSISSTTQQFNDIYTKYNHEYKAVQEKIDTGIAHASVTLDYLRQEENDLPRAGAVAMAGMAGLILGLRGGFFKRLLYTSVAASGMAGLCYPQQAMDISKDLVFNSKKYACIGYNFINGAKPEGPPSAVQSSEPPAKISNPNLKKVKGDPGQSNPADKDMYTTRT